MNEVRIHEAQRELSDLLDLDSLRGKSFLDVGSGSGLMSLAARRLGARVHSFDIDPESVACTAELRRRSFLDDPDWRVEQGSVLDASYLASLGKFDVVYSWGVLHHTGAMWRALGNILPAVASGGRLFIAIYNDQGRWSRIWKIIKRTYTGVPASFKLAFALLIIVPMELWEAAYSVLTLRPQRYLRIWRDYFKSRGMSRWHDHLDWVGGYPFEVAKPEEVFEFCRDRAFTLVKLRTCAGEHGNNEFVFKRGRDA